MPTSGAEVIYPIIPEAVREQMLEHARAHPGVGITGILVGEHAVPGGPVRVVGSIAAPLSSGTFEPSAWSAVTEWQRRDFPDDRIVGWYRSHADGDVGLFERDVQVQQHRFPDRDQFAVVLGLSQNLEELFGWVDGRFVPVARRRGGPLGWRDIGWRAVPPGASAAAPTGPPVALNGTQTPADGRAATLQPPPPVRTATLQPPPGRGGPALGAVARWLAAAGVLLGAVVAVAFAQSESKPSKPTPAKPAAQIADAAPPTGASDELAIQQAQAAAATLAAKREAAARKAAKRAAKQKSERAAARRKAARASARRKARAAARARAAAAAAARRRAPATPVAPRATPRVPVATPTPAPTPKPAATPKPSGGSGPATADPGTATDVKVVPPGG